jgi:hypothetical protein
MKHIHRINLIIALIMILVSTPAVGRVNAQEDAPPPDLQSPAAGQMVLNNTWLLERADSPGNLSAGGPRMLAADDGGNLNAAYGGDFLYYAYQPKGGSWQFELVDNGDGRGGVGAYASIAVDSFRMPHIAYYDNVLHNLKYAVQSCNEETCWWTIQVVDGGRADAGLYPSIAVDGAYGVHIAYYDGTYNSLRYAYKASGSTTWTLTPAHVDNTKNVGLSPSLALNGTTPCIAYLDKTVFDNVKVLFTCAPFTTHEQIDTNTGNFVALSIGGGYYQLAYQFEYRDAARPECQLNYNVAYRFKTPGQGSWTNGDLPLEDLCEDGHYPFRGFDLSMSLNSTGLPQIVFEDRIGGDHLRYFRRTAIIGGSWTEQTSFVTTNGMDAYYSIAMDGSIAHIWFQQATWDIDHVWGSGGLYQQELIVADAPPAGTTSSLATKNGDPAVAYQRGFDLYYTFRSGGAWSVPEMISDHVYRKPDLLFGPGPKVIYFQDDFENMEEITFAWRRCIGLVCGWPQLPLINNAWPNMQMNLTQDSTGKNYSVYKNGANKVVLASNPGGIWQEEREIFSTTVAGNVYANVDIDSVGEIHVIFTDDIGRLLYKSSLPFWPGNPEVIANLGGTSKIPNELSIYLDIPRVVYYEPSTGWLKYAPRFMNSWQPEPITFLGKGYTSGFSFVMDTTGTPYVAFYDPVYKNLVLGSKQVSGWQFLAIDTNGDVGQQPSLAVDANGLKRISYYDATNGDLKVAMEQARVLLPAVLR